MRLEVRTDRAVAEQAESAALSACRRARIDVRDTLETDDVHNAASVLCAIWENGQQPVTSELMRALSYEGNYVAAAFRRDSLVGASVGFLYSSDGKVGLHSHITGVVSHEQGRGAGFALKLHQRAWALRRGIDAVRWTYDPLVRRNAFFNIAKLGAEVSELLPNFYGPMSDVMNAGDESDRCFAEWSLSAERVVACSEGRSHEPDADRMIADGAAVVLDEDTRGAPVRGVDRGRTRLCHVPRDVVGLRGRDPGLARTWRVALREAMVRALTDGLRATGFTRSGWYVFTRVEPDGGDR